MEDKENCRQQNLLFPTYFETPQIQQSPLKVQTRRRLIRRLPKDQKQKKVTKKKRAKGKKLKKLQFDQQNLSKITCPAVFTQQTQAKPSSQRQQIDISVSPICRTTSVNKMPTQKIEFDAKTLPEYLMSQYQAKQKMKNVDLTINGVKFIRDLSKNKDLLKKWQSALIIYQQPYKNNQRIHFGLLLKHKQRLISFDGILKLWPIEQVEKSFHWEAQSDTWSCGYRVLFWVRKIQSIGIQRWVNEFQATPTNKQQQIQKID